MEYTLNIRIDSSNNDYIQDMVLDLYICGAISQEEAKKLFVKAQELKDIFREEYI